jgi:arginyl-tRNA synthetase
MNLLHLLQAKFQVALTGLVDDPAPYSAMVKPAQDARFGDYQANCAMSLAKVLGRKPREIAEEIVRRLPLDDQLEPPEIAGPGFINLRLRTDWLAARLQEMARDERLGVEPANPPQTLVIDFSSPNVAKPMHVGHLRSTIIGDSLARLFRYLGHKVVTDNHLGDWGTQFGMILYGYKHHLDEEGLKTDPVQEMVRLYLLVRELIKPIEKYEEAQQQARKAKKSKKPKPDEEQEVYTEEELTKAREVREAARLETAKLHFGDAENLRLWKQFMPWCLAEIDQVYKRLDVSFDQTLGESFYNPQLPEVVRNLLEKGIAEESRGAVVIPMTSADSTEDESDAAGDPPALIRKSDGAFTYTTSDLATIRYRMEQWKPNSILYVVDFRQGLHFKNLFDVARRWGYAQVQFQHISFGSVLGPDGKPIKTREGGGVELEQLLNGAVERAAQQYESTRTERVEREEDVPELVVDERRSIAEAVGLGAVKYADLSQNRESDYYFSWDKMLAMDGNTSTYMQYAYVRNRGIFRRGNISMDQFRLNPPCPLLDQPHERALAIQLLRFAETLPIVAAEYKPNLITAYLWDLAKSYSGFFQNCPVLKAETPELRQSRLLLCDLTARVIQKGLELLGIRTIERM